MKIRLTNGQDLLERGVTDLTRLRPVLATNADPMASNATLRKDEWERLDQRVNEVLRDRLTVVDDLRSRGLVEPVSLGTIIRRTERLQDFDDAELSYDGDTAPQRDRPDYLADTRPVPVISKDFDINWRQLEASRTHGDALDTTAAETSARKVMDRLQDLITNGASGGPTGSGIPGLTDATNRLTDNSFDQWNGGSGTPIDDVESMLSSLYGRNLFGPFILYVPKNYWAFLQGDYNDNKGDRTFLERIEAFADIQTVRPLDALADHNLVMIQMTRDVIDLSEAQAVTTVQWEKNPFVTHFRVLQVAGPHIKNIEVDDGTTTAGLLHSDLS